MTNREFYSAIANGTINDAIKAFAVDAIAKLDSKNENRRNKETPAHKDAVAYGDKFLAFMVKGRTYTASEIGKEFGISPNKATPALKLLVENGKVIKIDKFKAEKGKSPVKGYTLADTVED